MLHLILSAFVAVAAPACMPPAQAEAVMRAHGLEVVELTPPQRVNFQTNFNAAEPVTHYIFDHIVIGVENGGGDPLLILSINGCVVDAEVVPAAMFVRMMEAGRRGI